MSYYWSWQLKDRGFKKVNDNAMSEWEKACAEYVAHYLTPSIKMADCGWDHARFFVLESPCGDRDSYIGLFPNDTDINGRYFCVTGDSKGAMAEEIWKGVFA